jgi:hypothetical protein
MAVGVVVVAIGALPAAQAQSAKGSAKPWKPARLADGQPDIQGIWNNEEANFTPLELPKELAGRTTFTPEELQARAEKNAKSRVDAGDSTGPDDVGFYALYWFDWYGASRSPATARARRGAKDGRMPAMTPERERRLHARPPARWRRDRKPAIDVSAACWG